MHEQPRWLNVGARSGGSVRAPRPRGRARRTERARAHSHTCPPTRHQGGAVLDLCSSWTSHYPASFKPGRCAVLGLNALELLATLSWVAQSDGGGGAGARACRSSSRREHHNEPNQKEAEHRATRIFRKVRTRTQKGRTHYASRNHSKSGVRVIVHSHNYPKSGTERSEILHARIHSERHTMGSPYCSDTPL